jgi:N-acyl-D-aspartate/D-glutamate deacylase
MLGVTTAIMGNCGFGIVPSPPHLRDLIMRNLAVVEGMDLDRSENIVESQRSSSMVRGN